MLKTIVWGQPGGLLFPFPLGAQRTGSLRSLAAGDAGGRILLSRGLILEELCSRPGCSESCAPSPCAGMGKSPPSDGERGKLRSWLGGATPWGTPGGQLLAGKNRKYQRESPLGAVGWGRGEVLASFSIPNMALGKKRVGTGMGTPGTGWDSLSCPAPHPAPFAPV